MQKLVVPPVPTGDESIAVVPHPLPPTLQPYPCHLRLLLNGAMNHPPVLFPLYGTKLAK